MIDHDPDAWKSLKWANQECGPPMTPEALAGEIIWIILCAGRSAQAARTIEAKVWKALEAGKPVVEVFGYRAKANAMERAWQERQQDYDSFYTIYLDATNNPQILLNWCASIPFVGAITKYQLAKNLGLDVCKPDIWLARLAGFPDRPSRPAVERFEGCMALCRPLAAASGDKIAAVDTLLWLACNKGVLQVSADAGRVSFTPKEITARPILHLPS